MLLVDASVPTQNVDLGCAEWMYNNQVPFSLVFTKADKRKKKCPLPAQNIAEFEVSPASESCINLNVLAEHIQFPVPATFSESASMGKLPIFQCVASHAYAGATWGNHGRTPSYTGDQCVQSGRKARVAGVSGTAA